MAFGQAIAPCAAISPDAAKRQFDIASVRRIEPSPHDVRPYNWTGGPGTNDPGRFTAPQTALLYLILQAWGLDPDQLTKEPIWLGDGMNSGYAISATMPASTTQEEFCGMLRSLIAERFHLTFHFEKQPRPGYELTVMRGGPKFREYVPGPATPGEGPGTRGLDANGFPILPPTQPTARLINASRTGLIKESVRNNMAAFARFLIGDIMRLDVTAGPGSPVPRVIDKTGLTGIYDIRMEYANPRVAGTQSAKPALDSGAPAPTSELVYDGPNIFSALQQQLGLKLTKVADIQVDVMIIDHVNQTPADN